MHVRMYVYICIYIYIPTTSEDSEMSPYILGLESDTPSPDAKDAWIVVSPASSWEMDRFVRTRPRECGIDSRMCLSICRPTMRTCHLRLRAASRWTTAWEPGLHMTSELQVTYREHRLGQQPADEPVKLA